MLGSAHSEALFDLFVEVANSYAGHCRFLQSLHRQASEINDFNEINTFSSICWGALGFRVRVLSGGIHCPHCRITQI